jgi:hypothetical protein
MIYRVFSKGWPLSVATLIVATGCASSGAASSTSYDWSDFVGNYRFDSRLRGGDELRGSLTLHSPELYTLHYEVTGRAGHSCREVRNQERSNEVWAELQGNRLLFSCWGVLFRIWHTGETLDGTARLVNGDRGNLRFERIVPEF